MDEHIERVGRGRRENDKRCALCETIWKFHDTERDENREICKDKVAEMNGSIKDLFSFISHKVDWKVYAVTIAIFVSLISWIYVDHFGLSKQVYYNTAVIKGIDDKVDFLIKGQIDIKHKLNGTSNK